MYRLFATSFIFLVCSCGGGSSGSNSSMSDASSAALSGLHVSAGSISPFFNGSISNYSMTVATGVTSTTVTPTASDPESVSIAVNSMVVTSGQSSESIPLTFGSNTIEIVVTDGDGASSQTYTIVIEVAEVESIELRDPTPGVGHWFGGHEVILGNGNVVITDPFDSSRFSFGGAIHLYSVFSSTPIASLYGEAEGVQLGNQGIVPLSNNNFLVANGSFTEGGVTFGAVRLLNGYTLEEVGPILQGDNSGDLVNVSVIALPNGNYVVIALTDDENGVSNAGTVRVMSGSTGLQVGTTIAGQHDNDRFGGDGVTVLSNGNFVIASSLVDDGGITDAGSIVLVDGNTGVQIGSSILGGQENDQLGSDGVVALNNGNFVIISSEDDVGSVADAGSAVLVDGLTGLQIGSVFSGDNEGDFEDARVISAPNSNYLIVLPYADENGVLNSGAAHLMDGSTGIQIGDPIVGDVSGDQIGAGGAVVLNNHNFVIVSPLDDENGIVNAGSIRLVDGVNGVQLAPVLIGDEENDSLGVSKTGVVALANNNYVVTSVRDDHNGVVDAGSVILVNGATGTPVGPILAGDMRSDWLGVTSITDVGGSNYLIASELDDENGIVNAGTLRLVNAETGEQVWGQAGDVEEDRLGLGCVTVIDSDYFVVVSIRDDENGITDAGSVRLFNSDGQVGSTISGETRDDMSSTCVTASPDGDYYILSQSTADEGGLFNSGRVRIISL